MEPLACCVRAIKRADLISNDRVLVIGLGSIGYIMSQALNSYNMNVRAFWVDADGKKVIGTRDGLLLYF